MMMRSPSLCTAMAALVALAASVTSVDSFTVVVPSSGSVGLKTTSSVLNLLPEQGKQLEAAMNAALAKAEAERELCELEGEGGDCPPSATSFEATTATAVGRPPLSQSARALVARMFSLPSFRGHPVEKNNVVDGNTGSSSSRATTSIIGNNWNDHPSDDVVLFPLVGFQFVQDSPNHYGVLPSSDASNPSCRLRKKDGEEELVGWYSKACHLQLYGENYCEDPSL